MTATLEHGGIIYRPESALRRKMRALRQRAGGTAVAAVAGAVRVAGGVLRARTVPAVEHIRDHAYTIIGFGMADAAMFTHSVFTGLLVTAASFIVFEWKVS